MTSSYSAIRQWSLVHSSISERSEINIKPFSYAIFSSASSSKTNLVSPLRYAIGSNDFSITATVAMCCTLIVCLTCVYNDVIAECFQCRTSRHHHIRMPFLIQPVVCRCIHNRAETIISLSKNFSYYA